MYMALASGRSELRCACAELTLHTRTAMQIAEKLTLARFTVDKEPEADGRLRRIIRCVGAAVPAGGGSAGAGAGAAGIAGGADDAVRSSGTSAAGCEEGTEPPEAAAARLPLHAERYR